MSASTLLRPLAAASAVLALGSAPPALAASSSPATAVPDPSPGASSPAPDPYPGVTTRPAIVQRPIASAPVVPVSTPRTAPAVHRTVHRVRHHVTTPASTPPVRIRRPEPPAPSLGDRIFGAVNHTPRVPTGAALAVALLVLLSGLFLARVARETAR